MYRSFFCCCLFSCKTVFFLKVYPFVVPTLSQKIIFWMVFPNEIFLKKIYFWNSVNPLDILEKDSVFSRKIIFSRQICWIKICCTAQNVKFSIKDLFSKCDQIRIKLQIWSHLPKNSFMKNIFWAVKVT